MTTPHLTARQRLVADTLRSVEPISSSAMATMLGLKSQTVTSIMERLVELDLAYAKMEITGKTNQNTRLYRCGENPDPLDTDNNPIKRTIRKSWKPHHARDSLVAALFGPAPHAEVAHG